MSVSLSFAGESLRPQPCGALHWPAFDTLFVADLHFEKASAFARFGRLLPPHDSADTLACLIDALEATGARRIVCLGDSFHDRGGPDRLPAGPRAAIKSLTASLDWLWITGNHDEAAAASLGGRVMTEARIGPLTLRHEAVPGDPAPELSGHFHPKVAVHIRGRRIVRRCFAVSATKIILPAYGAFTGGLDVADPAITSVMDGPVMAYVQEGHHLLRFPIAA
ncbi:metallophosphatase [Polymorphobacter glacialis]|uniref:Metallophosphatase n=1 Tax=Sandarakinorhabdus glacialis TaxID=1614636 RepID=A0A916ZUT0_9SPHN|nr:ligase-associated DNA damage response endonuclease PdeM [Polymorphobacter glacialis]GGE14963.1 metallophosphatase [Polymorphobacter glacialis]